MEGFCGTWCQSEGAGFCLSGVNLAICLGRSEYCIALKPVACFRARRTFTLKLIDW